jgi:hypothetical protein
MKRNELETTFEEIFGVKPDPYKFDLLLGQVGEEKMASIFTYWLICGIKPQAEGKRFNPYALIYKIAPKWIT